MMHWSPEGDHLAIRPHIQVRLRGEPKPLGPAFWDTHNRLLALWDFRHALSLYEQFVGRTA